VEFLGWRWLWKSALYVEFESCWGVEPESALLNLLVQMDGIHGHLEQVGFFWSY
jgi:hypothetical protein